LAFGVDIEWIISPYCLINHRLISKNELQYIPFSKAAINSSQIISQNYADIPSTKTESQTIRNEA
jgi:hypothetical protein